MTVPTFQAGAIIEANQLPEDLQPNEQEIQESFDKTGTNPTYVVPTETELLATETAIESLLGDSRRLRVAREAILNNGGRLSNKSARILRAAVECMCEKPAVQVPEAFATGEEGAAQFAIESINRSENRIISRIKALILKWLRQFWMWIKSMWENRGKTEFQIEQIKKALPKLYGVRCGDQAWNAKAAVCHSTFMRGTDTSTLFKQTPVAFDSLWQDVQAYVNTCAICFRRDGTELEFVGLPGTDRLRRLVNAEKVYNQYQIGGEEWIVGAQRTDDGQYMFSAEAKQIDVMTPEGVMSGQQFKDIFAKVEHGFDLSSKQLKGLEDFAKKLNVVQGASEDGKTAPEGTNTATLASMVSVLSTMQWVAGRYDRTIRDAARSMYTAINNPQYLDKAP